MPELLKNIHIKNFKSLNSCHIKDCKRINLFIGRPNVGKSNILEALSVFSVPYLLENRSRSLRNLIRVENETEIFYKGNSSEPAYVETDNCVAKFIYDKITGLNISIDMPAVLHNFPVDVNFNLPRSSRNFGKSFIKRYSFSHDTVFSRSHARYLIPPYGSNLLDMIEQNEQVKEEISTWFQGYGLRLVFDKASRSLKIMQSEKMGEEIFLIPYNSIADTLQRMIFFKTAIATSSQSVLIFEEPEAHSFPPYISKITQEMISKTDNQYFIATHSPFILNDLLENAREDLSVYLVDYFHNETTVKHLSQKELHEIFQNGVDLFTNTESYL